MVKEKAENLKIKRENELTKGNKFLMQKIISKYDCMEDIDITNSNELEIRQLIMEYDNNISDEDKKELKKILERS